jgi:molybdenum storage protein
MQIDPRWRVVFLVVVTVGTFFLHRPAGIGVLIAGLVILWVVVGLGWQSLLRQTSKFASFGLFVVAMYALTGEDAANDRWVRIGAGFPLWLNLAGALTGLVMALRVLSIVLASQVARAGNPRALALGLAGMGIPRAASTCLDAVLVLVGEGGGRMRRRMAPGSGSGRGGGRDDGGGRGEGGGGGRGRHEGGLAVDGGRDSAEALDQPSEGFWASAKRLGRGDAAPIASRIQGHITRVEHHLAASGSVGGRDVAVIAGLALAMLGIRALKILPSIPFAPGHKLVVLTPLYIVAAMETRSPFGATLTGLTMGTTAFLMGDGRYGVFEIVKHVSPGIVCDLGVPWLTRTGRTPGPVVWSLFGGLIGATRFATIFAMTLAVQAPAVAYAILLPGLAIHTIFGVASGYVTHAVLGAMRVSRKSSDEQSRDTAEATATTPVSPPSLNQLVSGDGRTHIASPLMRESLVDRRVIARTHSEREHAILPDVVLVGLGGQSIFDRGRAVLLPIANELAALRHRHRIIVGVGGGTRVRHTISIAVDLGLPTGGIAQLVGAMEEANAILLNALLAHHGSIVMQREHFWELPLYLEGGMLPIVISIPPYHFWEPPPPDSPLPTHGSDFGLFIHAEVLGMKRVIFVKDEDGLHRQDPKKHPDAPLIRRISLDALLTDMPDELILDRQLFTAWRTARHVERVQIINGLRPGELTRALAGEDVGTVIENTAVIASTTPASMEAARRA